MHRVQEDLRKSRSKVSPVCGKQEPSNTASPECFKQHFKKDDDNIRVHTGDMKIGTTLRQIPKDALL